MGEQQRAGDVGAEADDGEEHHRPVRRLRPGMHELAQRDDGTRVAGQTVALCGVLRHRPSRIAPRASAGVRYVYCSVLR